MLCVGECGCEFRIEGCVVGMSVLAARGVCTCIGWVGGGENGLIDVRHIIALIECVNSAIGGYF